MIRYRTSLFLQLMISASCFASAAPVCPPEGYDLDKLRALRLQHFELKDDAQRQTLARDLLACLADADAERRDKVAYEAYATWRHSKALSAQTWAFVEHSLKTRLEDAATDPAGVSKPFAALVLAEAVKADRAAPYLSDKERSGLLDSSIRYFVDIRDYRGFDDDVGWRHGVAHAADLLGELALHPGFGKVELDRILAALLTQIVSRDTHSYIYGEIERFANAVAAVASRNLHSQEEWKNWIEKAVSPTPFENWAATFWSQSGLAKRHDTMIFLLSLYAIASQSSHTSISRLAPFIAQAMQPLG